MNSKDTVFEARKGALVTRLKRVEGQLRGIQAMISSEDDCARVAQQLSAARRALDRAFFETMRCALERELDDAAQDNVEVRSRVEKITALVAKYG